MGKKMKKKWLLVGILLLSLASIAVCFNLTNDHYELLAGGRIGDALCNISHFLNCDAVTLSPYAEIFGIAVSSLGMGYFIIVFFLAIAFLASINKQERNPFHDSLLLIVTSVGLAFSLWFTFASVALVGALCVMCSVTHLCNLVIFIFALNLRSEPIFKRYSYVIRHTGSTVKRSALVSWVIVMATCLILPTLWDSSMRKNIVTKQLAAAEQYIVKLNSSDTKLISVRDSASYGPKEAPLTIVEFSDFECPFCKKAAFTTKAVLREFSGQVRVVFKNYPLDNSCNSEINRAVHPNACLAARAGICATNQEKFWPFHDILFSYQKALDRAGIVSAAKNSAIDMDEFEKCLDSARARERVERDIADAKRIGVSGTPAFFFNGRKIEGAIPTLILRALIEDSLKKSMVKP
jgi:protein-disulfide isomerase/uncharacterized membrane protein